MEPALWNYLVVNCSMRNRTLLYMFLWLSSPCGPWPRFQFLNPIYSR
jgi:hypothetical protein